jgi:outer membrane protein OmpA-like peptidoglycan-associated protein
LPELPGATPDAAKLPAPVAPRPPVTVPVVAKPATAAPVVPKPAAPAVPKPAAPPARIEIAFATGSATLPADAAARLTPFCKVSGPIVINARAPADPDDNSSSMRLSLARALAVRAVLSACGVMSQNLLPRALGAAPGGADNITEIEAGLTP